MGALSHPHLSVALYHLLVLIRQRRLVGHVRLGGGLAVGCAWILTTLEPPNIRVRRPGAILELSFLVLADSVRSKIAVARIILNPRLADDTSGFVTIPLELRAPYGLAALAIIITSTPGTLWVNFDSTKGLLTLDRKSVV